MNPNAEEQPWGWLPECYDPQAEYTVVHRRLPHWCQASTLCFITWRTWDSMPEPVICL